MEKILAFLLIFILSHGYAQRHHQSSRFHEGFVYRTDVSRNERFDRPRTTIRFGFGLGYPYDYNGYNGFYGQPIYYEGRYYNSIDAVIAQNRRMIRRDYRRQIKEIRHQYYRYHEKKEKIRKLKTERDREIIRNSFEIMFNYKNHGN